MSDEERLPSWEEMGFPKPANNLPTKQQMRDVYRTYWLPRMLPLLEAQEARALGLVHFMLRDPETGEWKRLVDPDEIQAAMNHPKAVNGSTYRIHTKDPDGKDITDVLNRIIDKPKEQEQEIKLTGDEAMLARLDLAKRRARGEA